MSDNNELRRSGSLILGVSACALMLAAAGCYSSARPAPLSNTMRASPATPDAAPACELHGPRTVGIHFDDGGHPDMWMRVDFTDPAGMKVRVLSCKDLNLERSERATWIAAFSR